MERRNDAYLCAAANPTIALWFNRSALWGRIAELGSLDHMPPLLHIRVPETWKIEHHTLLDEDPEFRDGVCINLTEDLLQIRRGTYIVDAGFYRDQYRVMLVRNGDWEHPLRQRHCPHRKDVVSTVEEWLKDENIVA
jgi:hypothetical protein